MQKVSKYIYLLLKNSFLFAAVCCLLSWLSIDGSSLQTWFDDMALYGTMISVFLFFIHLIVLIFFSLLKGKKYIYLLLTNSFMFSLVSLLLSLLCEDGSSLQGWFSGIALYGTLLCIYLVPVHIIALLLSLIFKNNSSEK